MKMKKKSGIDGQLDDAWAKLVKIRAGNQCEYCGKTSYLNSHHIFTRSKRSVRWDAMNGICLCASHHVLSSTFSAHGTPTEFTYWLERKKGKPWIELLTIKANQISKLHQFEKEILLGELLRQINELE